MKGCLRLTIQEFFFFERKITKSEKNLTIFVVVLVDATITTTKTNCTRDLFLKLKMKKM